VLALPSWSSLPRNSSLYSRCTLRHRLKSLASPASETLDGWNTPAGMTWYMPPATATWPASRW